MAEGEHTFSPRLWLLILLGGTSLSNSLSRALGRFLRMGDGVSTPYTEQVQSLKQVCSDPNKYLLLEVSSSSFWVLEGQFQVVDTLRGLS